MKPVVVEVKNVRVCYEQTSESLQNNSEIRFADNNLDVYILTPSGRCYSLGENPTNSEKINEFSSRS